ncbi:MAG: phosphate/phosphite/phosphonate ABC transporter substrate-binding protein [Gammaproteobacteria bacterium]|nr:phosphate/phosphite/phosphonate ABC transporter substrate-binding protein [Gammaproteobacteria bacterium]MDH5799455.1 phosphate/phosphite/phosphonate ABC transporter substrate-binding protein [Gammaproteobacteria bacterium]
MKMRYATALYHITFLWIPLLAWLAPAVSAEVEPQQYILSAPPRETPDKGRETYAPIAAKLSDLLGVKVVYEAPAGWADYSQKMRKNKYDIVFDGPHFTAWRVKHLNHTPIAALPGQIGFYLITKKNTNIKSTRSLVGKRICGIVSPNLGTSLVYEFFPNPLLQPILHEVSGGMKEVYSSFTNGACVAAILRNTSYRQLPKSERLKIRILKKTRPLPNQTLTISHRLKEQTHKLADFLVSKEGAVAAQNLLSRYSKKARYFQQTKTADYAGIERLLEGVVWGW